MMNFLSINNQIKTKQEKKKRAKQTRTKGSIGKNKLKQEDKTEQN